MFLEAPVIFDPVNFSGNLPGNLREVVTSRKVTGESQNGGVGRTFLFQRRPFLAHMADWEVIERFRLSRARIEWLVEELKEELERTRREAARWLRKPT